MDADIKALENEVAKINPPPQSLNVTIAPPDQPPSNTSSSSARPTAYTASRGNNAPKPPLQFHPYQAPQAQAAALMQQQAAFHAARSAQVIAQATAARLQAQAAAINAARTRTLMSAAAQAQAQAVRAAAIAAQSNPSKPSTNDMDTNTSSSAHHQNSNNAASSAASVGPSYTKNNATNIYNKYGKYGGYYKGTNYKRFEYNHYHHHHDNNHSHSHNHNSNQYQAQSYGAHNKRSTTTIANSSLRNHEYEHLNMQQAANKKKKLKATHQYQLRTAANEQWVDPTMTDWPENDFRIFCGDLGNEVSDAMLTSAFSKYPSFAKAKVIRDKRTGKSKGYGFVSFLEPNDFIRAFKEMNGKYVGNRPIKLRKSKWKERTKKVKNFKIRE